MSALLFWISLALALTMGLVWWAFRRSEADSSAPPESATQALKKTSEADAASTPSILAASAPLSIEPIPPELIRLVWHRQVDLAPLQRDALLAAMAGITRPPGPVLQLLSADQWPPPRCCRWKAWTSG